MAVIKSVTFECGFCFCSDPLEEILVAWYIAQTPETELICIQIRSDVRLAYHER